MTSQIIVDEITTPEGASFVKASTDAVTGAVAFSGLGADFGASGKSLLIGTETVGAGKEALNISRIDANSNAVSRPTTLYVETTPAPTVTDAVDFHGIDAKMICQGANANITANTGFYTVEGKAVLGASGGQTMGKAVGVFGSSVNSSTSGTVTTAIGVQGETQSSGGNTTYAAAFYAKTPTISGGTVANAYGLFIQDILGATNNFAIQSFSGRVLFWSGTAPAAGGAYKTGIMMSSTNAFGIFFGSGAPTLTAAKGSLYLRTDGSTTTNRMYVNTDGVSTWTAVTTAA